MERSNRLYVASRDAWRAWLGRNHDTEKEIWVIYYKKHTGKPSLPYDESVEEALCFGWVDSIIRRIDDEKFARKFTPRKAKSVWSEANKKRARKMMKEGKMTKAGLAKIRAAEESGEWSRTPPTRRELVLPPYIKAAFAGNEKALENFNNLAASYKRQYVGWITSAKREETRRRRLAEVVRVLEKNERLGMK